MPTLGRCLALLFLFSSAVFSQSNTGRISGSVTDASGAAVPKAAVTITNEATGLKWKATTDPSGFYLVTNLPVGTYDVAVEAQGFRRVDRKGYDLPDDGRLTADFSLEIGTITQSIEVTVAAGEKINTVSGEVSRTI